MCPPELTEVVAYAVVYDGGRAAETIRCFNRPGDARRVRCDIRADEPMTLEVHNGSYCPGAGER